MIAKLQKEEHDITQNIYCSIYSILLIYTIGTYCPRNLLLLIGRAQFIYVSIVTVGFGRNTFPNSHNIKCHFHFVYLSHIKVVLNLSYFFNIFSCCIILQHMLAFIHLFIYWQTSPAHLRCVYIQMDKCGVGVTWRDHFQ